MLSGLTRSRYFSVAMFGICAAGEIAVIAFLALFGNTEQTAEGAIFLAWFLNTLWIATSFILCTWLFSIRWRHAHTNAFVAAAGYGFAMSPIAFGLNEWSISPAALSAYLVEQQHNAALAVVESTLIYIVAFALLGLILYGFSKRGGVAANLGILFVLCLPIALAFGVPTATHAMSQLGSPLRIVQTYRLQDRFYPDEVVISPDGLISVVETNQGVPMNLIDGYDQTFYQIGPDGHQTAITIQGKYWSLNSLIASRDGSVWMVAHVPRNNSLARDQIVQVKVSGEIRRYTPPTLNDGINALAEGPDGAIWFSEARPNRLGLITSAGTIVEKKPMDVTPTSMTFDNQGNLWFTAQWQDRVVRVNRDGSLTEFAIGPGADVWPYNIALGPDGAVWFTEYHGNRIGRIDSKGSLREFDVGSRGYPDYIVAGKYNDLWFNTMAEGAVWRITVGGVITKFPLDSAFHRHDIQGIAVDRDGSILFADPTSTDILFYQQMQGYLARVQLR